MFLSFLGAVVWVSLHLSCAASCSCHSCFPSAAEQSAVEGQALLEDVGRGTLSPSLVIVVWVVFVCSLSYGYSGGAGGEATQRLCREKDQVAGGCQDSGQSTIILYTFSCVVQSLFLSWNVKSPLFLVEIAIHFSTKNSS